jgi:MerR family transcriptional regulator/heat shock protein HspR
MEWPNNGRGVFAISVAADLAGLHPQTLRIYEREGLIEPHRSAGGTRLYSADDLARLRTITELTGSGLNLAGVKQVLVLQQTIRLLEAEIDRLDDQSPVVTRPGASANRGRSTPDQRDKKGRRP